VQTQIGFIQPATNQHFLSALAFEQDTLSNRFVAWSTRPMIVNPLDKICIARSAATGYNGCSAISS